MGVSIDPGYLVPGTRIGFYRIVSRVAAGGFGVLYRVERDGQTYALKIATHKRDEITPDQLRSQEERADRELVALKSLDHPNIVRVHAFERWPSLRDGHPFLIMDFVEGDRLNAWAARGHPSLVTICQVFRKIALALHEMHRIDIYHRDLKSDNVLVRHDGEPIIVDFGIARPLQARTVTRDHTFVGTSTHLPPEYCQFFSSEACQRGERFQFTPQGDLHAVGFMFYELLAGRPPFPPAEDDVAMMLTIIRCVPLPAAEVNPGVPRSLDAIASRLLEKEPGRRYVDGQHLADALELALAQSDPSWTQPHAVPPPPGRDRPTRGDRSGGARPLPSRVPDAGPGPLVSTGAATLESRLVNAIAETMKEAAQDRPPRRAKRSILILGSACAVLALASVIRPAPGVRPTAPQVAPLPPAPQQELLLPRATEVALPAASRSLSSATPAAVREVSGGHSLGVPARAELAVRLLSSLDDHALAGASVEALLIRPVRGHKRQSLPAGTVLYGVATQSGGRFVLRFKRAKLPDETQLEIDGLAYDASGTHGIAPTRLKAGVGVLAAGEEFVVLVPQGF
ncbi:MAG TPA: protein kinase [Myxococcales bacterium]|nr:protein kinase [Myxococcales bacterium]